MEATLCSTTSHQLVAEQRERMVDAVVVVVLALEALVPQIRDTAVAQVAIQATAMETADSPVAVAVVLEALAKTHL
jgi:hypothetical protein